MGVQGELHVAAAFYIQRPDDFQGAVPEHMVFLVGQGLAGSDDDGVAGVDTDGIHIFHVAHGDGGVVGIPDDLILHLVIALDALFHQNLMHRGQGQSFFHHFPQAGFVVGKAAAGAAQGKGGAQNHGITDFLRRLHRLLHGVGDLGGDNGLADGFAELLEQFPILGLFNGLYAGAQQLDFTLLQNALLCQLNGQIQTGLAADAGDNGIRPLIPADAGQVFQGQGLHVYLVGNGGVRHNGCGVGVCQNDFVALFPQGEAGLGACVIKFRGLTDDNGAGADDQNLVNIRPFRHGVCPPP